MRQETKCCFALFISVLRGERERLSVPYPGRVNIRAEDQEEKEREAKTFYCPALCDYGSVRQERWAKKLGFSARE